LVGETEAFCFRLLFYQTRRIGVPLDPDSMPEPLISWLTSRGAGVLLHPTSLPGPTGIGTLGRFAFRFVDFLTDVGMKYWQVCPLGPTGYGDSPYQCFSAFAGNPYLVDLEEFVQEGFLSPVDLEPLENDSETAVDYGVQWEFRWLVLRKAFDGFCKRARPDQQTAFADFRRANEEWLEPYAYFMTLKSRFDSRSWREWPAEFQHYRRLGRRPKSQETKDQMSAYAFYQFKFFQQWAALRRYATERGIRIFGDIPIFVAMDSADVWTRPELFQMTEDLKPTGVAGVPPDYFAADGQLWGNPLYAWDRHAKDDFAWWLARLRASFQLYDVVRIDHFRGFDEYCHIPPDAKDARAYRWEPGPGIRLFEVIQKQFPDAKLVAEDLGVITDTVRRLVNQAGLPGMKVLQFGFEGATDYLPHNCIPNSVLYPGTHDNDTSRGWFSVQSPNTRSLVHRYLDSPGEDIVWKIIHAGYASASRIFIVPMQDLLDLGSEARMNIPGQASGNWRWRLTADQLDKLWQDQCELLREYGKLYQR
jgi:4-alpha-glucanotransferase